MHLCNICLKNWGPHKSLYVDLNAPIAGITGTNGAGKSNVLQAIQYALTGSLPANKEDVIHNFGQENGAKAASVELEFTANGRNGHICREINAKSSKVTLTYGAEKFTKRQDVAAQLDSIIGVDKAALAAAVFIEQGAVDKLVRGTPAERQNLFFRVLNLDYLSKRATAAGDLAKRMREEIVDLTPAMEAVRCVISEQKLACSELEEKLKALPDVADAISLTETLWVLQRDAAAAGRYIDTLRANIMSLLMKVKPILAVYKPGFPADDRDTVESVVMMLATAKDALLNKVKRLESTIGLVRQRDELEAKISAAVTKKNTATQAVENFREECRVPAGMTPQECADIAAKVGNKDRIEKEIALYTQVIDELDARRTQQLADKKTAEQDVEEAEKVYAEKNREYVAYAETVRNTNERNASIRWKSNVILSWKPGSEGAVCPLCGGPAHIPTQQERDTAKALISSADQEDAECHAELVRLECDRDSAQSSIASAKYRVDYCAQLVRNTERERDERHASLVAKREELDKVVADIQDDTVVLVREANLQLFAFSGPRLLAEQQVAEGTLAELLSLRNSMPGELPPMPELTAKLDLNQRQLETISAHHEIVESSLRQYDAYTEAIEEASKKLRAADTCNESEAELATKLNNLREQQADRKVVLSSIQQKKDEIENSKEKLEKLEAQSAEYEERLKTIKTLETAKDVLSRPNLPMAYASRIFNGVTGNVNTLLAQMGANFTVHPDPIEPITFRFTRTDDPQAVPLSQERLSGGQAVRLSLALLISMQRMLMSNVGLLVLDEPSSHIDADGIDNMALLFRALAGTFEAAQMQLIVVDHSPVLAASFGKNTELKRVLA